MDKGIYMMKADLDGILNDLKDQNDLVELLQSKVKLFDSNWSDSDKKIIGYCITLGGDGTILWACKQFRGFYVPNMITFAFGSLGYMCMFMMSEFKDVLHKLSS